MTNKSNHVYSINSKKNRIPYGIENKIPEIKINIPESNISLIYDLNKIQDIKNQNYLILSLINNCSKSIGFIEKFMQDMCASLPKVKFCFFSNNNIDNTIEILKLLEDKYKNILKVIYYQNETITKDNRIEQFAKYRNINFSEGIKYFGSNFDKLIVFDSDLYDFIPTDPIIESLCISDINWSCISGNHCYKNSSYYYDELALRFLDDKLNIKDKYKNFDEYYGISEYWIDNLNIINNWIKVLSAFGGISIYNMSEIIDIYNKKQIIYDITNLPEFSAEHIALNLQLKNDIIINPNIKYTNSKNIEGKMYNGPIAFVPRDAGFFSVFNFLIGCLTKGMRVYPYFNKQSLLQMNGNINEHFCYWTENDNCWFDYFEPMTFYNGDTTHLDGSYIKLPKHRGEIAPVEFRIPKDTKALIQNKEKFAEWRKYVNGFYKQYIKYNSEILKSIDEFWNSNFSESQMVIGVHYRHPSHFIESGKIYLQDYFREIDKLIDTHPNSKIFLATDSNFGIYAFQEKYGDKVSYIKDIERLTMPEFLEWSFSLASGKADEVGFINGKGYELHHKRIDNHNNKKLTVDLLKEVLCLAKCGYMVHTTSNVALAISYMNPDLELISL